MIDLIAVGKAGKTRGVDGHFKLHLDADFRDDMTKARALFIELNASKVPFLIESFNDANQCIKVEEIDNPEEASRFIGKDIYLETKEISQSESNNQGSHNWINYKVVNQDDNFIGHIIALQEYPKQILLEVQHQTGIALIPVHEDLILQVSDQLKMIKLEIADGLINL